MNTQRSIRAALVAAAAALVFPTFVQGASPPPTQGAPRSPLAVEQAESGEPLLHLAQHPRNSVLPVRPRFIVEAVGYRAVNETGADWTGSDEIYGIFADERRNIRVRTLTQGDVDTGNTRSFAANQSCMAPINVLTRNEHGQPRTWACDGVGVRAPFTVVFDLYENDDKWTPGAGGFTCFDGAPNPVPEPDCEDDHIGNRLETFTEADLRASLPNVGASVERTVRLGGYAFTYRITRVQNEPTVQPPRRPPASESVQVHSSGTLNAVLTQHFEFDSGAVLAGNGDLAFTRLIAYYLTPAGGARIWPGGASPRGRAACAAGGANYVTSAITLPAIGAYVCYITNEGRVGEFRIASLTGGTTLTLNYTTWQ